MRDPRDELLIALSHGLEGWMAGSATDAVDIAHFVSTAGNQSIPRLPEAIEQLLTDLRDTGHVDRRSRLPILGREGFHATR